MRLFTAIDLPPEIVERLGQLVTELRPLAKIRWSPAENFHITTKFIGACPEERLPELEKALAGIAGRAAVKIRVRGLGFYPGERSPHVFYAGVEASPELVALAKDIDQALTGFVEPETRVYSPHLTLARIKEAPAARFLDAVRKLGQPEFGSFTADRFFLYVSKPGAGGSVYTKLSEFPFTN